MVFSMLNIPYKEKIEALAKIYEKDSIGEDYKS